MNLKDIKAPKGAKKNPKRIGRGHGSGWGKTAAKGHKGQKARSGGSIRPGFEGGQMPLHRRIPKFGFTNIFRKVYSEVKLADLVGLDAELIDPKVLDEAGLLRSGTDGIKILGNGEIDKAINVRVDKVTASAKEKIEAAGGKVEIIEALPEYVEVNASKADKLPDEVITLDSLIKGGLVPEGTERVRLVKRGALKTTKTFKLANISRAARRAIKATGGKIEEIG